MAAVRIIRYQEVASTNAIAVDMGRLGCESGTVVVARRQSGGRGRRGRTFCSPAGGLYLSLVLRPRLAADSLPLMTLAAGVAAALSVEQIAGTAVPVELKWPNDLYLAGLKLGGILTESGPYEHEAGKVPFIVVGLGLNVNTEKKTFPPDLQERVTSLYDVHHRRFDLDLVLEKAVHHLMSAATDLLLEPEAILRSWRRRDYLLGRKIHWHDEQGTSVSGIASGLLADGCYEITAADGRRHAIVAGDLEIIPSR
jgi:BirA family biotin operon repressor/biotin-[acetyl-CoA-carboxylase] ligase